MDVKIIGKLDKFFSQFKLIPYKKGSTLIGFADDPIAVFYLQEGFVKMTTVLANGNELTINIYKPGSFFPMFWALGEVPNKYAFEAMTNVTVYKSPRSELMGFLKENSEVALDLSKRILSGVDGLLTNLNHLMVGSSSSRVASALLIASKRFGELTQDGKTLITLKLTHQDIANLAGITRETASIVIGKLSKKNIVKQIERKFVVYDMDRLYEETSIDGELLDNPVAI